VRWSPQAGIVGERLAAWAFGGNIRGLGRGHRTEQGTRNTLNALF